MEIRSSQLNFIKLAIIAAFTCYSAGALANGFYLPFYNVADMGEAYSGGAALAQDASTAYTNPAGLSEIEHQQLVLAGTGVIHRIEFRGTGTSPGLGSSISQTGTANSSFAGVLPAFYYALPLSNKWALGFSVTSPYGLGDNFGNEDVTRYYVTYAAFKSADLSPNVSYKITDKLSAGVGLDFLYMELESKQMYRTQPSTLTDSFIANDMSGWGYGWHAGLLYKFTPKTRVGLAYHSPIVENLSGTSKFYTNNGVTLPTGVITSNNVETTMHLPPFTTLSLYQGIGSAWAVMATAEYMEWSYIKNQHMYNAATFAGPANFNIPKNFHDTWRFALGTSYQLTDKWLLRTGAEYDQDPTNNRDRDVILPSSDRYLVGIGAHYQINKDVGADIGYAHAFFENQSINNTDATTGNTITGSSRMSTDALGLQVEWNIT